MTDLAEEILKRPVLTEKASVLREKNKYVVEVAPTATKGQVRQAIEARFKVSVVDIQTIKVRGKFRRKMGPKGGYQSDRKKALIQIKEGQQLKWEEV